MALAPTPPRYPDAPRVDHVDEYFGTVVPDPYRWLEDLDAPATRAFVEEQNALTESILAGVPARDRIRARLTELWDYERWSVPTKIGDGTYAYFRNTGLQNQAVLLVTRDLAEPGRVLLDPNTLSEDGTVALGSASFSDDGSLLAYSTTALGSDWLEWHVRDVATGKDRPDLLRWSKFSGAAWKRDGSGFYYSRYEEPAAATQFKDATYFQKVYFHRLGTPQSTDLLIYERSDHPDWSLSATTTQDGRYLVIDANRGTDPNNGIFVADLRGDGVVRQLLEPGHARYDFVGNDEATFYFASTQDAARGRVIAVPLDGGPQAVVVPEAADALSGVSLFGDHLVLEYLRDALAHVVVRTLDGSSSYELTLPGPGSVGGFTGKRSVDETFYAFTSYTTPTSIFRFDVATGSSSLVFRPRLGYDVSTYSSEQVFYTSKDGTRVPMLITAKHGTPRDGSAPTILTGYGGFDIPLTPGFSTAVLVWLEMGGVFAAANLRGGGEYGEAWHTGGMKENKQNVFDDCIAAAEYLIAEGWTSSEKLALQGGSNGGLLVGACIIQRPDLFGAALPAVGVFDMLRFDKFTIGWAWRSEYGSPGDPSEFRTLHAYSPLHTLVEGTAYPPTLITTGDHDDRVFPAHSLKFAAALQHAQSGSAPILLRVETKAGHGAGKPTAKIIGEVSDRYAFLVEVLGIE